MERNITAWFSIGSTYTFLTAMRIKTLLQTHQIEMKINPISIKRIMGELGNAPFTPDKPFKINYMWRDIERRAVRYGVTPPKNPVPFPVKDSDFANCVGIVMNDMGRYLEYFEETYKLWFIHGIEAGSDANIKHCMEKLGYDFHQIVKVAKSSETKDKFEFNTNRAMEQGIFGVPSFTVGNDLFWGDDRIEDAIDFFEAS